MLIGFSVGNYRSFKDVVTLSMVAAEEANDNDELDKNGSSLPFMLNQQTRCQDNILLTQKFRKFLKP